MDVATVSSSTVSGLPKIDLALPLGLRVEKIVSIINTLAVSAVILLVSYNLISQALLIPGWQVIVATVSILAIVLSTVALHGQRRLLHWSLHSAIYLSGGLIFASISDALSPQGRDLPPWKLWLVYTGVYALLFILMPQLIVCLRGGIHDPNRFQSIANDAREAHMRREAELVQLPSHGWYILASWVTGLAMCGSFATTAIGFYDEIVDPYSHWAIRFGIPIGLSALAAFIIWAGWNFVFLRLRVSRFLFSRVTSYFIGLVILVPLTLFIHTVFGIIGVGGTEGLRAHYMWYADVLSGYYDRAERLRQTELRYKPQLDNMYQKFSGLCRPRAYRRIGLR